MNDIINSEISPTIIPQNSPLLESVFSTTPASSGEAYANNGEDLSPIESSVAEAPLFAIPAPTLLPTNTDISVPDALNSSDTGSLDLIVHDFDGRPISDISIKILINKITVFIGITDSKGKLPTVSGLKQGSVFEIRVKKENSALKSKYDDAENYKFAAIGKIATAENFGCLQSPKTRFEFSTEDHMGPPGDALEKKQRILKEHNQTAATIPKISGNKEKSLKVVSSRDAQGSPKIIIGDGQRDWFDRNGKNESPSVTNDGDIDHVKKLIAFGEMQAAWSYDKHTVTATYIQRMISKTFETPPAKKKDGFQNSLGMCAKYVKIALWYAGFGPPSQAIGNSIGSARDMGPALISAGFKDITKDIPDARWAAPGDVIVYQRIDNPSGDGHIDIRTYDGYLSDFCATYLPSRQFKVIGTFRKYSDLIPIKRMRAFLKVIASQEAKAIFERDGYAEAYRTLPYIHFKVLGDKFNSFETHPFASSQLTGTASGAYGILVDTWRRYLTLLNITEKDKMFSPLVQDRIAIAIMDNTKNSLGLVRIGKIKEAGELLYNTRQWTSLPHAGSKFTVEMLIESYDKYYNEEL